MTVNHPEITGRRLWNQHVALDSPANSPKDALTSLGALQAQDYQAALWAIGLRCRDSTVEDVEEAIAKKEISRTWLMRGTLHFAASEDVHWMLKLFAPRLINTAVSRDRSLGLGDDVVKKAEDLFAKALRGNKRLTRDEMYRVLDRGGVRIEKNLGYHMLYRAAWDGVICFGAHEGKQPAFELLDERITLKGYPNGDAPAELASRYFTSHGPATVKDFVWWSGLRVSDAKAGIEASRALASEESDGKTYYMAREVPASGGNDGAVHLLPAFDEYLVGYSDRSAMLGSEETQKALGSGKLLFTHSNGIFLPVAVAEGEVVGTWRRRNEPSRVVVTVQPFARLSEERMKAVKEAAQRYGDFLGRTVALA